MLSGVKSAGGGRGGGGPGGGRGPGEGERGRVLAEVSREGVGVHERERMRWDVPLGNAFPFPLSFRPRSDSRRAESRSSSGGG